MKKSKKKATVQQNCQKNFREKIKTMNQNPRKGWSKAAKEMVKNGNDKLLMPDIFEDETFEDWV